MNDNIGEPDPPVMIIRDGRNLPDFASLAVEEPVGRARHDEFLDCLTQRPDPEQCRTALRQALDQEQRGRVLFRRHEA